MDLRRMALVPKMSKYEWDRHCFGLDHEGLLTKYRQEGVDMESILASHERQRAALAHVTQRLGAATVLARDDVTRAVNDRFDLVISLGGDNHFQYLTHFLTTTPILGMNSDVQTSVGALTPFLPEHTDTLLARLEADEYEIEEWTRLAAQVNGHAIEYATCIYFIGEAERQFMSRHILEVQGQREEQKGAGLLVVTGAGSTGWYDSACRYQFPDGNAFPPTAPFARFLLTEPYRGRLSGHDLRHGELRPGEELHVHSLNDDRGLIGSDSIEVYPANRGTHILIRLAPHPLRVVAMPEVTKR
jgi:NAD kinase